ncbi:MAG: substrate-binding domain-containing protein [Hyphomicrobiales bacterium]|nr:substrate-binding domain-containing protein [Hyphomicrobiales bacterium]
MDLIQPTLLKWPAEAAVPSADKRGVLNAPGSNLVLDLHGDPVRAKLTVFSDGNHHMALANAMQAFVRLVPEVDDIFYATTPPRILVEALESGTLRTGNLVLSVSPHVFIGPPGVLGELRQHKRIGPPRTFMRSCGVSLLVRKGNPERIGSLDGVFRDRIRLAISNPKTERVSFDLYRQALLAAGAGLGLSEEDVDRFLNRESTVRGRVIHHREVPHAIAAGRADVGILYHHLALRFERAFPDQFELVEIDDPIPGAETAYDIAPVGDGGAFGPRFVEHMVSKEVGAIYQSHGLVPTGRESRNRH